MTNVERVDADVCCTHARRARGDEGLHLRPRSCELARVHRSTAVGAARLSLSLSGNRLELRVSTRQLGPVYLQVRRHSAQAPDPSYSIEGQPKRAGRGPLEAHTRPGESGVNGEWVTSEMVLCCARMLCCEWVLCARDADEMCGARCSRHVVSGACGVDRHPVCPSQGQRRGHGVYWSLPSLCLSQPRAEERARVAWGEGWGSCVVLVCVTTNEKNAEAGDVTAAAASQCTALVTPPTNPLCMCARAWAGDGM